MIDGKIDVETKYNQNALNDWNRAQSLNNF